MLSASEDLKERKEEHKTCYLTIKLEATTYFMFNYEYVCVLTENILTNLEFVFYEILRQIN
jgi:hypothetical protein